MGRNEIREAFLAAKSIQQSIDAVIKPPQEITAPNTELILTHSLFRRTRGYIERVVYQINATYQATAYDACAVMIRRLVETLIIEVFESKGLEYKIKTPSGDYMFLGDLIDKSFAEPSWHIGRLSKSALVKLKGIGDLSAHNRRYNAQRSDIDKIADGLRVAAEELLYLSGLR